MQESYENTPHISVSQCMNCSQVFVEFPYHRKHHEFRGGWIPGWELRPDRMVTVRTGGFRLPPKLISKANQLDPISPGC